MCSACRRFLPAWESITSSLNGAPSSSGDVIRMFHVNDLVSGEIWQDAAKIFGLSFYPSVMVKRGGGEWKLYEGESGDAADKGYREDDLTQFITNGM
ncbi:hypothetical protein TrCOL_g4228 [Triparma columacea]|nr:hypothetical protein TrCOL_g4228 [Triparma columacea]